jgi:hypothetical protein
MLPAPQVAFFGGNLIFKRMRLGTLALHRASGYRKSVPSLSTIEHLLNFQTGSILNAVDLAATPQRLLEHRPSCKIIS